MSDEPDGLEKKLGHRFRRPQLLVQALTHSSTAQRPKDRAASNERLEFLGDRVLGLVTAGILFENFPDEDEGDLAPRHTKLVRREALTRVALDLGLGAYLTLSRGEEEAGGRKNPGVLADAMEAVIAALYLDGGLETAADFISGRWRPLMAEDLTPPTEPKTALQEWAQGRGLPLPQYSEKDRQGPPHEPVFTIEVTVEGKGCATATGSSKRAAERDAASILLGHITGQGEDSGKDEDGR